MYYIYIDRLDSLHVYIRHSRISEVRLTPNNSKPATYYLHTRRGLRTPNTERSQAAPSLPPTLYDIVHSGRVVSDIDRKTPAILLSPLASDTLIMKLNQLMTILIVKVI